MARPTKSTIDYFPHYVNHRKTMFILEGEYGNDGYAFWFKLLEILGSTDGMVYDCKNIADWRFLLAKTRLSEETANNILNTLADLDAIDKELWINNRIVWSQNLVDNVRDAFKRRVSEMPQKPFLHTETPLNEDNCIQKPSENDESVNKNEERKGKEKKGEERKEESNASVPETLSLDTQALELCQLYETLKPGQSIAAQLPAIKIFIQDYGFDWTKEAMQMCISKKNGFIKAWIEGVLKNWKKEGHTKTDKADTPPVKRNAFGNYSGQRKYDIKDLRSKLGLRTGPGG